MTHLDEKTARETLVYEALRFANWAAGEGICPVEGENAKSPEDFLMDFSNATNDEDWDTFAERLSALSSSPVSELVDVFERFDMDPGGFLGERGRMEQDPTGDWVRYSDAVNTISAQKAVVAGKNATLTTLSTRNAELEREVKRLREAQQWNPIETAPKDGSWINLWRGPTEFGRWSPLVTARWHEFEDGDECWVWPDGPFDPYTEEGRAEADELIALGDHFESTEFSHWRSLSTSPQGGEHE